MKLKTKRTDIHTFICANTTNFHFQPTFALPAAVGAITFSPQPESFMHALNDESK